jgi:probable phosphoglycerate mutase
VWLRHGRTEWNSLGRFQGQTDIPLDAVGIAQAERSAAALRLLEPHLIVSSDLERARATAHPLAEALRLQVRLDERLRETWAGEWEGLTHVEIRARYGETALEQWALAPDTRPGGGESRIEVATRMVAAVEDALIDVPAGQTLVVVTHGGAARAGMCAMLGLPPETWGALGVLSNCAWSVLLETNGADEGIRWRLAEYNASSLPAPAIGDDA